MLTTLAAVAVVSVAHADGQLVGAWQGQGFAIRFDASGQYAAQASGSAMQGQWIADGQTLQTASAAGMLSYRYQIQGSQLLLVDASGAQLLLQRAGAQPAAPAAGAMSPQEWLAFLEGYPAMGPDQIYHQLTRLDPGMASMLGAFGALRADLLFRACQGSYASQITVDGGCASIAASRQQAEAWSAQLGMPLIEHDTQRQQVITSVRCELGLNTAASCQVAAQATQQVNDMMHDTSMQIIDNIGNQGCTEYYDQGGAYVGCW